MKKFLAYDLFASASSGSRASTPTIAFMHGILGHKRNWRTAAQEWRKLHPQYSALTLDHRGHGSSGRLPGINNVFSCSNDVRELISSQFHTDSPTILVGHSFSGKVALQHLENCMSNGLEPPQHAWILDSLPGLYPTALDVAQHDSVHRVFDLLLKLPPHFPSREWVVEEMCKDVSKPIALWIATNAVPNENSKTFRWGFDLSVIHQLFESFCETDMWDFLRSYDGASVIHFVRAGRNPLWTHDVLGNFEEIARSNPKIRLHTMPHVGHWLHTEDLAGLLKLVSTESK